MTTTSKIPANVTVENAEHIKVTTLVHPETAQQYDFAVRDSNTIEILFTPNRRHSDRYTLPIAEARALYRRLRAKGFEKF